MNEDQPPRAVNVTPLVIDAMRTMTREFIREHGRTPEQHEADALLEVVQCVVFATIESGEQAASADVTTDDADPPLAHLVVTLTPSGRRVHFELRSVPRALRMH